MATAKPLSVAELLSILPRVHATLELLVGEHAGVAAPVGPRRNVRASSDLPGKLLVTLRRSKKGYSLGELVKAVGAERGAVKYHLRALRAQKKARVKGDRKTARWLAA